MESSYNEKLNNALPKDGQKGFSILKMPNTYFLKLMNLIEETGFSIEEFEFPIPFNGHNIVLYGGIQFFEFRSKLIPRYYFMFQNIDFEKSLHTGNDAKVHMKYNSVGISSDPLGSVEGTIGNLSAHFAKWLKSLKNEYDGQLMLSKKMNIKEPTVHSNSRQINDGQREQIISTLQDFVSAKFEEHKNDLADMLFPLSEDITSIQNTISEIEVKIRRGDIDRVNIKEQVFGSLIKAGYEDVKTNIARNIVGGLIIEFGNIIYHNKQLGDGFNTFKEIFNDVK